MRTRRIRIPQRVEKQGGGSSVPTARVAMVEADTTAAVVVGVLVVGAVMVGVDVTLVVVAVVVVVVVVVGDMCHGAIIFALGK
jgi:hypothetical protein